LLDLFEGNPLPYFQNLGNNGSVTQNQLLKLKYLILNDDYELEREILASEEHEFGELSLEDKFTDEDLKELAKKKPLTKTTYGSL
jgi:hypothetical protein